ncbi:MAG: signal peptidase II [Clostridia bacterium]|nr:signal peptidase II [Clostridia bacterium]
MLLFLIITFSIIVFDQITKVLITNTLSLGESIIAIPKLFNFTYVENRGAAFGLLQGARVFFIVITVVILFLVILYFIKKKPQSALEKTALAFIAGGAIGNFIDRVYLGYVRDFIETAFMNFPVFNVADCFVCIGAALYIIFVLCEEKINGKN